MRAAVCALVAAVACGLARAATEQVNALFYESIVNQTFASAIQEFPVLLDVNGAIGSTSGFGSSSGILALVETDAQAAAFAALPESAYVALISQAMFQKHAGLLKEQAHCRGFLVFDARLMDAGKAPPEGSPDNYVPNAEHGMSFGALEGQRFNVFACVNLFFICIFSRVHSFAVGWACKAHSHPLFSLISTGVL